MNKLFCFGYGYTAHHLSRALAARGDFTIAGTTRDHDKLDVMAQHGIDAHLFSYDQGMPNPQTLFRDVTHVLISVPPDDNGDPVWIFHGDDLARAPNLKWVGYLSSTAVYGDRGGDWVDEQTDVHPVTKRGMRRSRAERQWLTLYQDHDFPAMIFRLAGIYGPGRSALETVRAGAARRINKQGHAFSRVHIDDIVQTLIASMTRGKKGRVYNVADDYPAPSHEVIAYTCELLGLPVPPLLDFNSADLAPITMSFYTENKRVRNDLIKDELGVRLQYPTFREGLLACRTALEQGDAPGDIPSYWFTEGRESLG